MKITGKFLNVSSFCIMTATLSFITASCRDQQKDTTEEPSLLELKAVSWEENKTVEGCKIYADYPSDSTTALSQNIREWMNEQLGGIYEGNLNDGEKMIGFYGKKRVDEIRRNIEEFGENSAMDKSVYYVQIRDKFETASLVTYTSEIYEYSGGAHGGEVEIGSVFRKSDGRRFGWDMFTAEGQTALRDIIKNELKEKYFKVKSDEEFYSMLLAEEARYVFPLPDSAPYFMRNGVKFIYQQYEIAPYAAGKPYCIIPYEKLTDFFTATMKPLVASTKDKVATELFPAKYMNLQ